MSLVKGYEKDSMNTIERILATVTGKTPDRIPIYPMLDSTPSELFHLSIEEYFSSADNLIKGQKKLQELLNLDYVSSFFYLAIESEIYGMKTIFFDSGSPNTGKPCVNSLDYFSNNSLPELNGHPSYNKTIKATKGLAELYKGKKPIISVQTGPFSFPSLIMGASKWFESILMEPDKINISLDYAIKFGINWANGHVDAGADVIVLVDGLATATSIPRDIFEEFIIPTYKKITQEIKAPIVFYTAGGDILPFADILGEMGVIGVFPSANDDLNEFKVKSNSKYALFGNINNLEFGDWPIDFMEEAIRQTIETGKPNGKFILATQHMIPNSVPIEKIGEFISIALKYAHY